MVPSLSWDREAQERMSSPLWSATQASEPIRQSLVFKSPASRVLPRVTELEFPELGPKGAFWKCFLHCSAKIANHCSAKFANHCSILPRGKGAGQDWLTGAVSLALKLESRRTFHQSGRTWLSAEHLASHRFHPAICDLPGGTEADGSPLPTPTYSNCTFFWSGTWATSRLTPRGRAHVTKEQGGRYLPKIMISLDIGCPETQSNSKVVVCVPWPRTFYHKMRK